MDDISRMTADVMGQAWDVVNVLTMVRAAMNDDVPGSLPIRCTLSHVLEMAEVLPDRIEQLMRAVRTENGGKNA